MNEKNKSQVENELTEEKAFDVLESTSGFQIRPYDGMIDLEDTSRFTKIELSPGQKMQISALLQQVPQAITAGKLAKAYTVTFPDGLPHTLTALKQGGYGSMIRANGHFAGSASFYPITAQAVALGAFTVMSAVTGQYFLTQINGELKIVNQKLDEILGFLYGEKKAELLAEINFVKYAHSNFGTIMMHEDQRSATIGSLQSAKLIAMKDIEFYLSDLDAITNKSARSYEELCSLTNKALRIKDSIEMSRQLYVVSGLLELYYAQNYEEQYISYIENDMISYVNKCDRSILSALSAMRGRIIDCKVKREKVQDKEDRVVTIALQEVPYKDDSDSPIRTAMENALEALHKKAEYFVDKSGNIYMKRED